MLYLTIWKNVNKMIMNLDALNANEISRDCLIYLVHLGWLSKTKVWVFFHFVRLARGKKNVEAVIQ